MIGLLISVGVIGLVLYVLLQIEEHENVLKDSENEK